jgi:DNA modification methylase
VVWANANAVTGGLYRSEHKLLLLFKKGFAAHFNRISLGKHGCHRTNLWTYPATSLGSDARRGRQDHPTAKPTAMLEDALAELTNPGEIVLDPFLGSGSSLIAADNTGRVRCGVEIDPLYVDVTIRRFQASTGIAAIFADSGETFEQLATQGPSIEEQPRRKQGRYRE